MINKIFRSLHTRWYRKRQKLHLLKIGRPTYINPQATFNFHSNISIGRFCQIGSSCYIDGEGGVMIGEGSILAPNVVVLSSSHDYEDRSFIPYGFGDVKRSVIIGKGCWLGWGVLIRPGVTIGDGAIVAMGSVVTKDVSSGSLVGGNPARFIKQIRQPEEIKEFISQEKFYLKEVNETGKIRSGRNVEIYKKKLIK